MDMDALRDVYSGIHKALLIVCEDNLKDRSLRSILDTAGKRLKVFMDRYHRDKFARPDEDVDRQ
jgi:hypothetical protein